MSRFNVLNAFSKNGFDTAILANSTLDQQLAALFASGEQGVWYDIDPAYCYQDAAGTTPAVVGQPVGLVLDRSKGLALGPELVGTYNFTGVDWGSTNVSSRTANEFTLSTDAGGLAKDVLTVGKWYLVTVEGSISSGQFSINTSNALTTPTARTQIKGGFGSCVFLADSKYLYLRSSLAGSTVTISKISVRELPGNHASQTTATSRPILRQNATTGAHYLEFDGSDDWLVTNSIDFTATDKMTVWAGVYKNSASLGTVYELSVQSDAPSYPGAFYLRGNSTSESFQFSVSSASGALTAPNVTGVPNLVSHVTVNIIDLSAPSTRVRINGTQRVSNIAPTGGGPFGNYPLYIGRRGGTTLPFNGHLYGLLVRGAQSAEAQIKLVERYLAKKTGVALA